jgi:hypothetical protein
MSITMNARARALFSELLAIAVKRARQCPDNCKLIDLVSRAARAIAVGFNSGVK